jgi:ketosteroid isomerase-like protein
MSTENMEVVRELIALGEQVSASGVTPPHTHLVTPDAVIDMSRRVFNPGIYRGFEGWRRLMSEVREVWADWQVTIERFVDAGDRVVTIETVCGRGHGSGLDIEARYGSIWTLQGGRVTRVEMGLDPREALEAVGLED